jgi:hypothetical protein
MKNPAAPLYQDYQRLRIQPTPLVNSDPEEWARDLESFLEEQGTLRDPFFTGVATHSHDAYRYHKEGKKDEAMACAEQVLANDWRIAMVQWLQRRAD